MPKLKWFSQNEYNNFELEDALWLLLDQMREAAGVPFIITSGRRNSVTNALVGGAKNSAHLRGLAADLKCNSAQMRKAMLKGIMSVECGVFIELTNDHIHVDIDGSIHGLDQIIIKE